MRMRIVTLHWAISGVLLLLNLSFGEKHGFYEGYQVLRVVPKNTGEVSYLRKLMANYAELDFWYEPRGVGQEVMVMVPPEKLGHVKEYLENSGLHIEIFRENVQSTVDRQQEELRVKRSLGATAFDYEEYHTYDEIMQEADDYPNRCPNGFQCQIYSIGQSYEGRDMKMLRIYKDEPNRGVYWVDSLIHAREWLSGAVLLNMVNHMLTNYATDSDVQMMLDKGDWHFLFVHNPDGYDYTWSSGERLWRKNRYNNTINIPETWCMGVDLNRNYMQRWRNSGAETDPCRETYAGWHPASEVETQNVQTEVFRLQSRLKAFVTLHTFGRLILMPWGSVKDPWAEEICEYLPEPYHTQTLNVATAMAKAIEDTHGYHTWEAGTSCGILYAHGGTTQDFVAGWTGMTYSFTPELRDQDAEGNRYLFEAPPSEIRPAFQETWNGFVAMVKTIDEQSYETGVANFNTVCSSLLVFALALSL